MAVQWSGPRLGTPALHWVLWLPEGVQWEASGVHVLSVQGGLAPLTWSARASLCLSCPALPTCCPFPRGWPAEPGEVSC